MHHFTLIAVATALLQVTQSQNLTVTRLDGSGSTLLCSVLEALAVGYKVKIGVDIEYQCVGSGAGKQALTNGGVDFAGTDAVFRDVDYEEMTDLQMIPVIATPTAIIFNLPGLSTINLGRSTLSKIFSGAITNWSDQEILLTNPQLSLPNSPIEVVVRNESSGTTEILTKALSVFGNWPGDPAGMTNWPDNLNATRIQGSTILLDYVKTKPYTISYMGVPDALANQLTFASLINKAGRVTIPGWDDGKSAVKQLTLNTTTLTGDLMDTTGYPLSGLSYIAFRRGSAKSCAVMSFLYWVLTSSEADSVISSNSRVPLSENVVNVVLPALYDARCEGFIEEMVRVTTMHPHETTLINTLGYSYHSAVSSRIMVRSDTPEEISLASDDWNNSSEAVSFPFVVGLLGVGVNFGIAVPSIELPVDVIEGIFKGNVTDWSDSRIREKNNYVPATPRKIVIVCEESRIWVRKLLEMLKWPAEAIANFTPDVVLPSSVDVALYVKQTPGSVSPLSMVLATEWELSVIHPIVNDLPVLPSLDNVGRSVTSNTFSPDMKSLNLDDPSLKGSYPFFYVMYLTHARDVPKTSCKNGMPGSVDFLTWALHYETSNDNAVDQQIAGLGLYPIAGGLGEIVLSKQFGKLTCGGGKIFVKEENRLWVILVIVGVLSGVAIAVGVAAFIVKWRAAVSRYNNLYGANVLATETAEAVAGLDFEILVKLKALENPDRIQAAMLSIITMMNEFMKYIPQHVIKSVKARQLTPLDVDISSDEISQSSSKTSGRSSQNTFTIHSIATRQHLPQGALHGLNTACQNRTVIVLVARLPLPDSTKPLEDIQNHFLVRTITLIEQDSKGMLHRIQEDSVIGVWGSLGGSVSRTRVSSLTERLADNNTSHVGVFAGHGYCGYMGTDSIKSFHVLGGIVEEADCLARVAQSSGAPALLPHDFITDKHTNVFRFFKVVSLRGRATETRVQLPAPESTDRNIEWMYQLPEPQEPLTGLPGALRSLEERDYRVAADQLSEHLTTAPQCRFTAWLIQVLDTMGNVLKIGEMPPIEPGACGSLYTRQGHLISGPKNFVRQCVSEFVKEGGSR